MKTLIPWKPFNVHYIMTSWNNWFINELVIIEIYFIPYLNAVTYLNVVFI